MVRINLLPVRVSRKKQAGKQQLVLFALVIAAGFAGNFVWASARAGELARHEAQLKRTKDEIAQLEKIIGEVKNIKVQQQQLREKLDVLDQLKEGRTGPVRMLDELATVTPKRLWLTKFEEKGGLAKLSGIAASIDDVSELMSALKRSTHFQAVELDKTTAKADSKTGLRLVDFSMTAKVAYAPKAAAAAASAVGAPAPAAAPAKPAPAEAPASGAAH
jgi:type IV pilus assembly protein PilN